MIDPKYNKWTPVEEGLPEHDIPKTVREAHTGVRYLVTLTTDKVVITTWKFFLRGANENGLLGSWAWSSQYRRMIKAWRSLPEPYIGEEETCT